MMKELCFSTDKKLCIRLWSSELEKVTGRPSGQVEGKKYYEVIPRIYLRDKDRDAVLDVIKNNKPASFKKYNFACMYGGIEADIRISPIITMNNEISGARISFHPYSICSVAQKMNQSQRLIDIGKVASSLAHGVRNPLNAIKGAIVYLREKYQSEGTLVEFTNIIEEEISILEDFISRFLSSSISDEERSLTDINLLLKKVGVFTSLQMHTRNITARHEFGDVPPVLVNPFHLEQAILNIVNNAIEAMKSGGLLTVKTRLDNRNSTPYAVIEISDSGIGMNGEERGGLSLVPKEKGKGFGLFITYEIVKYYGGHLEILSSKDEGTTVRLFLPSTGSSGIYHA